MKRGVKVVMLVVSHAVVFGVGAVWFTGDRTMAMFRAAAQDPLYRVGAAMMSESHGRATASLEFDLSALARTGPAPTADVIRLAVLLEQGRTEDAGVVCTALAWPNCDPQTLAEMRNALVW